MEVVVRSDSKNLGALNMGQFTMKKQCFGIDPCLYLKCIQAYTQTHTPRLVGKATPNESVASHPLF